VSGYITTPSGAVIDLAHPERSLILLEDVAEMLAKTNRWCGSLCEPISVAEHAVVVSRHAIRNPLLGLHHDDHEAYLGDISYGLKKLLPGFRFISDRWDWAIFAKFGVTKEHEDEVKAWDRAMLRAEYEVVGGGPTVLKGMRWNGIEPGMLLDVPAWARPRSWREARDWFLDRHRELVG
jgi:hypothetical protein